MPHGINLAAPPRYEGAGCLHIACQMFLLCMLSSSQQGSIQYLSTTDRPIGQKTKQRSCWLMLARHLLANLEKSGLRIKGVCRPTFKDNWKQCNYKKIRTYILLEFPSWITLLTLYKDEDPDVMMFKLHEMFSPYF